MQTKQAAFVTIIHILTGLSRVKVFVRSRGSYVSSYRSTTMPVCGRRPSTCQPQQVVATSIRKLVSQSKYYALVLFGQKSQEANRTRGGCAWPASSWWVGADQQALVAVESISRRVESERRQTKWAFALYPTRCIPSCSQAQPEARECF